jgi:hypothetical protein
LRAGSRPRERAAQWLRQFLADGPRRAPEVIAAAEVAGVPLRTLERVKAAVGVVSEAKKHAGKVEWWWSDPAGDRARGAGNGLPPLPLLDGLPPLGGGPPTRASIDRLIRVMNRRNKGKREDDDDE